MSSNARWVALAGVLVIVIGATITIVLAQGDGDIFQGGELPTPTDTEQAEIDALTGEAFGLLAALRVLSDAENCRDGCDGFGSTPPEAFQTLLARCDRSGWPDEDRTGSTDVARTVIDAINETCNTTVSSAGTPNEPSNGAEYKAFAAVVQPALLDVYESATGHAWPGSVSEPSPLDPGVLDAIAAWVATEQNSEHIGPCPSGDAPADTIGKWCHLPPREAEANRIVIWVGAVASGNVWELVLEKDQGDTWTVVSAEKVRGT